MIEEMSLKLINKERECLPHPPYKNPKKPKDEYIQWVLGSVHNLRLVDTQNLDRTEDFTSDTSARNNNP